MYDISIDIASSPLVINRSLLKKPIRVSIGKKTDAFLISSKMYDEYSELKKIYNLENEIKDAEIYWKKYISGKDLISDIFK